MRQALNMGKGYVIHHLALKKKSTVTLCHPQMLPQPRVPVTKDESVRVIYLEIQEMVVQATALWAALPQTHEHE